MFGDDEDCRAEDIGGNLLGPCPCARCKREREREAARTCTGDVSTCRCTSCVRERSDWTNISGDHTHNTPKSEVAKRYNVEVMSYVDPYIEAAKRQAAPLERHESPPLTIESMQERPVQTITIKTEDDIELAIGMITALTRNLLSLDETAYVTVHVQQKAADYWGVMVDVQGFLLKHGGERLGVALERTLEDLTSRVAKRMEEAARLLGKQ